jgi:hypothetical protein
MLVWLNTDTPSSIINNPDEDIFKNVLKNILKHNDTTKYSIPPK